MDAWEALERFGQAHAGIITIISLVVAVVSIALAVVFYRMGKPIRRLSVATRTFRIVSNRVARLTGIAVTYRDSPVSAISFTRLAIWNAGTEPVRSHDVPEREPLRLATRQGVTILAIDVGEKTREANQVGLVATDSAFPDTLKFDFLEPGDGVVLNIVHDGSGRDDVFLTGSIVGGSVRHTTALHETYDERTGQPKPVVGGRQGRGAAMTLLLIGIAVSIMAFGRGELATGAAVALVLIPTGLGLYVYTRRTFPPPRIGAFDLTPEST